MKNVILVLATFLLAGVAHADYNNPSPEVANKLVAAAMSNLIVQAAVEQSAKEVSLATPGQCNLAEKSVAGEVDQGQLNGSVTLTFDCNAGDNGSRSGEISGDVFSGKFMLSSLKIQSAG